MIVVGVDVQKRSLTVVAVDEVGRSVAELTVGSARELIGWSASLAGERLWAVEDCRQLCGALERSLARGRRVIGAGAAEADGTATASRSCAREVRPDRRARRR